MEQMKIVTSTDLSLIPQTIEWNHEELKKTLKAQLEVYNNLVVSADAIKSAKSDRANLNKLATAVEEYRKDVKRRCLEPYNALEAKCKELVGIIREPIEAIDRQIKVFEDKEKQDKYDRLKAFFDSKVGDLKGTVDFEKILNPKWANKTQNAENLEGEIEDNLDRIRGEIEFLEAEYKDVPYKTAIIEEYLKDYSKSKAIVAATTLKFRAEQLERKKRAMEEAAKAAEAEKAEAKAAPAPEPVPEPEPIFAEPEPEKTLAAILEVTGTADQIKALGRFLRERGMKYEVVRR